MQIDAGNFTDNTTYMRDSTFGPYTITHICLYVCGLFAASRRHRFSIICAVAAFLSELGLKPATSLFWLVVVAAFLSEPAVWNPTVSRVIFHEQKKTSRHLDGKT